MLFVLGSARGGVSRDQDRVNHFAPKSFVTDRDAGREIDGLVAILSHSSVVLIVFS